MKAKLSFYVLVTLTSFSPAFGESLELLNPSKVKYSFDIRKADCTNLQILQSQKLELSKHLYSIALQGEYVIGSMSSQSSESLETATEPYREIQKTHSSIVSHLKDLSQKIIAESNTRGGLRVVDYVSAQTIPQQSEIFYTDVSSFPAIPLEDQPSFLGYRIGVRSNIAEVTSVLSKGYACLLLLEGMENHTQNLSQMLISRSL